MPEPPAFLADFLAQHDAPCPVCSYNLRGVALPRCPECDSPITLTVGSEQARLGPWLLAVQACAMGLGFDSVAGTFALIPTIASGGEGPALWMLGVLWTLCAASGLGIRALIRGRRRFQSRPRREQWRRAWKVFALVFFVHLAGGFLIVLPAFL